MSKKIISVTKTEQSSIMLNLHKSLKVRNIHMKLALCLVLIFSALNTIAQEPKWWTDQKRDCGLEPSLAYNTWVAQGEPCNRGGKIGGTGGGAGFKSPIGNGIMGAMLGGLGGSVITANNGENQWVPGALIGYGFFSSLSLLATSKNRSRGENIVLGIVVGGTAGAGGGMYEKANASATSAKPDNTLKYVAIGVVVVGGLAAVLPNEGRDKKKKSSSFYRIGKPGFLSKTSFGLTGNGIGIIVRL